MLARAYLTDTTRMLLKVARNLVKCKVLFSLLFSHQLTAITQSVVIDRLQKLWRESEKSRRTSTKVVVLYSYVAVVRNQKRTQGQKGANLSS